MRVVNQVLHVSGTSYTHIFIRLRDSLNTPGKCTNGIVLKKPLEPLVIKSNVSNHFTKVSPTSSAMLLLLVVPKSPRPSMHTCENFSSLCCSPSKHEKMPYGRIRCMMNGLAHAACFVFIVPVQRSSCTTVCFLDK